MNFFNVTAAPGLSLNINNLLTTDKLIILSEGRLIWAGEPSEAEVWFSKTMGLSRAPDSSVADWILDVVNISFEEKRRESLQLGKTLKTIRDLDESAALFKVSAGQGKAWI